MRQPPVILRTQPQQLALVCGLLVAVLFGIGLLLLSV